ncbi:Metallo-dependent phosphatase-like protein [Apodospora peruviana]|uniref:Metallo-dependent phosphatase-like protein n=1 Tax=Apodospora peruviana TaxID=516989 RepID=A0AAE0III1_9PEZI|nr:Metallo-dependent phosphatase-like protein [Apodospora peruviana]
MMPFAVVFAMAVLVPAVLASSELATTYPGSVAAFTVPGGFPTTVYSRYYVNPGPTNEPQPALWDPVLNITFPFSLTDPEKLPDHGTDPPLFPTALTNLTLTDADALISTAVIQILQIIGANSTGLSSNCSKCIAALSIGQLMSKMAPTYIPDAMVSLCQLTHFKNDIVCKTTYGVDGIGASWTQVLSRANVAGLDGQYICAYLDKNFCPPPPVLSGKAKFPKPKPPKPKQAHPSGQRVKVLHLSDLHLDTRYKAGSEANCTGGMCCRYAAPSMNGSTGIMYPAPLFGYYRCDSPFYLALAALQSIGPLTGTCLENPPALTLYTGDLVAHDPQNELSQAYLEATEDAVWQMFKAYIGGPVYAALGNHDTSPINLDIAHLIDDNGPLGQQFSWNYEYVSKLWEHYSWIDNATQVQASLHYGAYSVVHHPGLRIITINTDFYYRNNIYAFLRADDPDFSGIFSFLIEELQKAEDAGQRAWIVGHAHSGWDGLTALPNGSDMLYQIIERYSPHVVANLFWGHTHEDQVLISYTQNGTRQTTENAIATGWIGPSLTPLTNLNSGYRLYEVDTGSWDIMEAYTFVADVGNFGQLNETGSTGPVFELEYSTRSAYGPSVKWPDTAPLNAAFWHKVTEAMEQDDGELVSLFNTYQGKSSPLSPNCTSAACAEAKVCYMRSGSTALGRRCPKGFGSVQSAYTPDTGTGGGV